MKRCPQCEFLYEEEQRLCDMDGTALVHDSAFLLESGAGTNASRSIWKVLVQIGLPLVVLSLLAFYVFKNQTGTQNAAAAPAIVVNDPETSPDPAKKQGEPGSLPGADGSSMNASPGGSAPRGVDSSNPDATKDSTVAESVKANATESQHSSGNTPAPSRSFSPTPNRPPLRPQPQANPQKKESRVTSFLKKTGRFLKRPFEN